MKQSLYIQFKVVLLLLIYLFSSSPIVLFHHHKSNIPSLEKATLCEKTIYYSSEEEHCTHHTHIITAPEKCSLCDNHTTSPHFLQIFIAEYFGNEIWGHYIQIYQNYYFQIPTTIANRGPPMIDSPLV